MKKKTSISLYLVISFTVLGLVSLGCKKDKTPTPTAPTGGSTDNSIHLTMKLNPTFNGNTMYLDSTYTTSDGYPVQINELKFFLTNVMNDTNILVSSAKLDWKTDGLTIFSTTGKPSLFSSLSGNLGVDSARNHLDPISFSTTDPLYLTNANDMHWAWNPGYIFVKVEGHCDTISSSSNAPLTFVYHIGLDANKQVFQWNNVTWTEIDDKHYEATINLKMEEFFNNPSQSIDLKTERETQSESGKETLTLKIIQQFNYALQAQ